MRKKVVKSFSVGMNTRAVIRAISKMMDFNESSAVAYCVLNTWTRMAAGKEEEYGKKVMEAAAELEKEDRQ